MLSATKQHLKRLNPELLIWPLALAGLAFMHPEHPYPSICPLKWLGFTWCPGCGLGRSVSYLLHGNLAGSWQTHKLGVFALAVLLHRIGVLAMEAIRSRKQVPTSNKLPITQAPTSNNFQTSTAPASTGTSSSVAGNSRPISFSTNKTIKTPI